MTKRKRYTVQCLYPMWFTNTVHVEGERLDEACAKAIERANDDSAWRSLDDVGNTFICKIVKGHHDDCWADNANVVTIPPQYRENPERHVAMQLLTALRAVTDWMREHTSPRDVHSPHALMIDAMLAIGEAEKLGVVMPDAPAATSEADAS
jgi:hypothetical protein